MEYRTLGRTGLKVSEVGHGVWGMGGWTGSNEADNLQALQLSLNLGCNFFDSAWIYGNGKSDQLLGRLIHNNPDSKIIVADKIPPKNLKFPASSEDKLKDVFPNHHVIEYTKRIIDLLGVETIDVLQFHVWDDSWADDNEWKDTVAELKAKKLIRNFGLSLNRWEPWNGIKALRTGLVDVVQVIYNIFDQAPEDELFPICNELNIGVIARVPLDEGGLSGTLSLATKFPPGDWRAGYFGPENLGPTVERADKLKTLLSGGMSLPELAIRFILSNKIVNTTIIGMRTSNHVRENLSFSDGSLLSGGMMAKLRNHRWDRKVTKWAN